MLEASKKEFEDKVTSEMGKLLKMIKEDRKEIKNLQKSLKPTVTYFDTQDIKIKEFIGYGK